MPTNTSKPVQARVRSRVAAATAIAVAASSAVVLPGTAVAQSNTLTPRSTTTQPATVTATLSTTVTAPPVTTTVVVPTTVIAPTRTTTVTRPPETTTVTAWPETTTVTAPPTTTTETVIVTRTATLTETPQAYTSTVQAPPVTVTTTPQASTVTERATVTVRPDVVTSYVQAPAVTVTATAPTVTTTATAVVTETTTVAPNVPAADRHPLKWSSQPVRAGRTTTAALNAKLVEALPAGTTFTTDHPGATVDDNGRVTFAPGLDAPTGATLVPVKATFADGSAKEYSVRFDVAEAYQSDRFEPGYQTGKGAVAGQVAVIDLARGPQLPESTRFLLQEGDLKGWKVAVDRLTGRVSALAPANAQPIAPTVWVSYGDGSDDYITVPIGVLDEAKAASNAEIAFDVTPARAGESTVVKPAGNVPAGATFEIAPGSTNLVRSINPATGEMIVDLPASAQAGSTYAVTYRVHFADGSSKEQTVSIPVRSQASEQTVGIPAVDVTPGGRATGAAATAPEGTSFALAETFAVDGWQATVDAATGRVAVSAPVNATAGTSVKIPVVATFADGSQKLVTVTANVVAAPAPVVATTPAPAGSAEGKGWLWIVLGTLAALGGIGFAATLNQQWIREQAAQFGIRF